MNKTTINRAVGFFRFSLLCCCPLWYYADPLDRIAVCISQQTDVKLVWWTHTSLYWWRAGGDLSLWCGPESADQQAALYAASALARKAAGPTTCAPPGAETWATGSAGHTPGCPARGPERWASHEGGQRALHSQEALGCLANAEEQREQEPAQKH